MPSFAQAFPLLRVINLPERKDRLREMSDQLDALGCPFTPGQVEAFPAVKPSAPAGFPSIGARGCFLSHLQILKDAQDRALEAVLILEDDLEVHPEDIPRLDRLLAELPEGWGILYPGHIEPLPANPDPDWQLCSAPLGTTHCYAVHRRALPDLIAYLETCLTREPGDPAGGPMHYDGALSMFRAAHPQHRTFIANPSLAGQRSSRSDIAIRPLEQVYGMRYAVSLARRLRRRLRGR